MYKLTLILFAITCYAGADSAATISDLLPKEQLQEKFFAAPLLFGKKKQKHEKSSAPQPIKIVDDKTGQPAKVDFNSLPSVAYSANERSGAQDRIVDGYDASSGMFPYMASLRLANMKHVCGAAILNKYWLVTAAHCGTDYVYVVVGSTTLDNTDKMYLVNQIRFYGFNETNLLNDIALVKISTKIDYSVGKVKNIKMYKQEVPEGGQMIFPGFGYTSNTDTTTNKLQYMFVKQMNIMSCSNTMSSVPDAPPVYYSEVCATASYNQGACTGDSGGPLVYQGKLVGVFSWSPQPCGTYPNVFTNTYWYNSWISQVIKT